MEIKIQFVNNASIRKCSKYNYVRVCKSYRRTCAIKNDKVLTNIIIYLFMKYLIVCLLKQNNILCKKKVIR